MWPRPLHTVVEVPEFLRCARGLLTNMEREALVNHLAAHPDDGEVMSRTGGARKLRWATAGRGKSGSVRVITFYSGPPVPVFLMAAFGKGAKINLTMAERGALRMVLGALVKEYREGVERHVQGRR